MSMPLDGSLSDPQSSEHPLAVVAQVKPVAMRWQLLPATATMHELIAQGTKKHMRLKRQASQAKTKETLHIVS